LYLLSHCSFFAPVRYPQGTIFRTGHFGSIVEIKRIEGPIFNSKEAAEQHRLELCKSWIDKRPLTAQFW